MYTTLIDAQTLHHHLLDPEWIIVDCRFTLADPAAGYEAYRQSHIPGAVYAHLDYDLSGPPVTDRGRHPLPTAQALTSLFGRLGIDSTKQVVAYDAAGGANAAGRLWWLLRYMDHHAVAVLDGGWQAWQAAELPVASGEESNPTATFEGQAHRPWLVLVDELPFTPLVIDSREPARYRGETEPIDPVAGHIPGATNYPYSRNLDDDGRFLPPDQLRQQLQEVLGEVAPAHAAFYCGSGVTTCANLLALAHAGLGNGRLYAGSWSDWISDPERPISRET
jgi:thiosulfate/3-mercaptopyruvate sulfurtransferase